jgi:hypothetical protein
MELRVEKNEQQRRLPFNRDESEQKPTECEACLEGAVTCKVERSKPGLDPTIHYRNNCFSSLFNLKKFANRLVTSIETNSLHRMFADFG